MINAEAVNVLLKAGAVLHQPQPLEGGDTAILLRDGMLLAERHSAVHVTFNDVTDLAAYLNKHFPPVDTRITVGETVVQATSTPADPHGEVAIAVLETHPLFKRWGDTFGRQIDQRQLLRLLRMAEADLDADGKRLQRACGALVASGSTEFKSEVDARGLVTMGAVSRTQTLSQELPDRFTIDVPLFVGVLLKADGDTTVEPFYRLEVLVEVGIIEGKPVFLLTAPSLDVVRLRARQDVRTCLRERLDDRPWLVGLGTQSLQTWQKLQQNDATGPQINAFVSWRGGDGEPHHDGPFPTPTHDDGNCGPAEVGHDGPPPGETGIADVTDHS
jgi:hypothetical protein